MNAYGSAVTKLMLSQVVCGSLEVYKSRKEDYGSYKSTGTPQVVGASSQVVRGSPQVPVREGGQVC